jgi:hypothetical protein
MEQRERHDAGAYEIRVVVERTDQPLSGHSSRVACCGKQNSDKTEVSMRRLYPCSDTAIHKAGNS